MRGMKKKGISLRSTSPDWRSSRLLRREVLLRSRICLAAPHPLYVEAPEPWLSTQDGPSYIERIFEGSQVTAATPFIASDAQTIPPPRDAWLTAHLKTGTWLAQVLQDGDVDRVDGAKYFSATFPPTMFIHGTKDTFTEVAVSEKAYESLTALGVDTEILLVPGANHMLDIALEENDEFFREYVLKGLNFLAKKVGLLE
jgi:acetyl esterase/lipase